MKRLLQTIISLCLVFVLIWTVGVPRKTSAANAIGRDGTLEKSFTEADGTLVEKGKIGERQIESRTKGDIIVTTISYGDITEVVEVDKKSPFFSVTTNGETVKYDRREFIADEIKYNIPTIDAENIELQSANQQGIGFDEFGTMSIVPPSQFFGSMYTNKWLATMNSYTPYYATAMCYENYTYYLSSYTNYVLNWFTAFTVALGITGLTWSTLYAVIASITVIVDGILYVMNSVNVEKEDYVRYNTRFSKITQDPNGGVWCQAGRTRWSHIVGSVDGVTYKDYSDTQHSWYSSPSTINTNALNAWYSR